MSLFVFDDVSVKDKSIEQIPLQDCLTFDISNQSYEEIISSINDSNVKCVVLSCSGDIYKNELTLFKLLKFLSEQKIVVQVKDIPLCYLQDYPWFSYDLKLKLLSDEGLIEGVKQKQFFIDCEKCTLKSFCPGAEQRFSNQVYRVFKPAEEVLLKAKKGFGIKEKVAVFGKFNDYSDLDALVESVKKGFEYFGGVEKLIPKGAKVLIKPNLAERLTPDKAATTHPKIIQAIVRAIKNVAGEIFISDLAAGTNYQAFDELMTKTGMKDVALEENVKIIDMSRFGYVVKKIKNYFWLEKTDFLSFLDQVDVVINVPKMKTHGITFFTCCVKSSFGVIHPEERKYIHAKEDRFEFAKGVVDVYSVFKDKIALHVVDGIIGMEGDEGPSYGDPVNTGLILIGKDGVAVDAVVSKVMGYEPKHIPTIKFAIQKYLGEGDLENIKIVGDFKEVQQIIYPGFKKNSLFNFLNTFKNEKDFGKAYIYKVSIDSSKCNLCMTCYNSCPVGAIVFDKSEKKLRVVEDKCIHCYTCHEVCPHGAIKLNKAPNF